MLNRLAKSKTAEKIHFVCIDNREVQQDGGIHIILENNKVKRIAKKILERYFKSLQNKNAVELLDNTDCIIEITPEKLSVWSY